MLDHALDPSLLRRAPRGGKHGTTGLAHVTQGSNAWGTEIQLRAAIEEYFHVSKNLPIVQLMVQGGPGTISTVKASVEAGNPVVVLSDTGGAAEALHDFVVNERSLDELDKKFAKQGDSLQVMRASSNVTAATEDAALRSGGDGSWRDCAHAREHVFGCASVP